MPDSSVGAFNNHTLLCYSIFKLRCNVKRVPVSKCMSICFPARYDVALKYIFSIRLKN